METLEIIFARRRHIAFPIPQSFQPMIHVAIPNEFSWMDEPLSIPDVPLETFSNLNTLSMQQIDAIMAKYLSSENVGVLNSIKSSASQFSPSLVFHGVLVMEDQKAFFGHTLIGILKKAAPKLRTVVLDGTLDEKWMVAVANSVKVEVQARLDETDEWVTVELTGDKHQSVD